MNSLRLPIPPVFAVNPLITVLRASHATAYDPVVEVLVDEGVLSIELTMTTPGTIAHLEDVRARVPGTVELGVGSIVTVDDAAAAIDAGADYLVTPSTDPSVITHAVDRGVRIFPGGLTPTELALGWSLGATAVKLFPAATVGPGYLAQLRGPFPHIRVIPSGGIGIDDIPAWLQAGASAVSVGGPLLGDSLAGGDLEELRTRLQHVADVRRQSAPAS